MEAEEERELGAEVAQEVGVEMVPVLARVSTLPNPPCLLATTFLITVLTLKGRTRALVYATGRTAMDASTLGRSMMETDTRSNELISIAILDAGITLFLTDISRLGRRDNDIPAEIHNWERRNRLANRRHVAI